MTGCVKENGRMWNEFERHGDKTVRGDGVTEGPHLALSEELPTAVCQLSLLPSSLVSHTTSSAACFQSAALVLLSASECSQVFLCVCPRFTRRPLLGGGVVLYFALGSLKHCGVCFFRFPCQKQLAAVFARIGCVLSVCFENKCFSSMQVE